MCAIGMMRRTRLKTIEFIVERTALRPRARKYGDNDIVPVRIGYAEKDMIESARIAKGRWNADVRLRFIR